MNREAAKYQIWQQVRISIGGQIDRQIKIPIWKQIRGQVREQAKCRIGDQVWSPIINAVCLVWDDIWILTKRDIDESKQD
jgi:hypothetical protein